MQMTSQKVKKTFFSKLFSFWLNLFEVKEMQIANQTLVNKLSPALATSKYSLQHQATPWTQHINPRNDLKEESGDSKILTTVFYQRQ